MGEEGEFWQVGWAEFGYLCLHAELAHGTWSGDLRGRGADISQAKLARTGRFGRGLGLCTDAQSTVAGRQMVSADYMDG